MHAMLSSRLSSKFGSRNFLSTTSGSAMDCLLRPARGAATSSLLSAAGSSGAGACTELLNNSAQRQ
eukprot:1194404-Prorocentrum_minimum.AAC.2